jgi:hypothetical protein
VDSIAFSGDRDIAGGIDFSDHRMDIRSVAVKERRSGTNGARLSHDLRYDTATTEQAKRSVSALQSFPAEVGSFTVKQLTTVGGLLDRSFRPQRCALPLTATEVFLLYAMLN